MGIEKKVVSIRLDDQLVQELRVAAQVQNRSLSNLIETVLKEHLSDLKQNEKNCHAPL